MNDVMIFTNITIPTMISLIFMGFLFFRFQQLQNVAQHTKLNLNLSLVLRLILLSFEIICVVIDLFLSQFDKDYYSFHKEIVFFTFIPIITMGLQMALMVYEYNKNVPLYYMHKIYWLTNLIVLGAGLIIIFYLHQQEADNYLVDIVRFFFLAVLNIYTLFIRRQDIHDFEDQSFFSTSFPKIHDSYIVDQHRFKSMTNYSVTEMGGDANYIKVALNQGWSLIQNQSGLKVEVKLDVQISNQIYKVKHTIDEFLLLWTQIEEDQSNQTYFEQNSLEYQEFLSLINQIKDSQTTQLTMQLLEKYIAKLTSKIELACSSVIEFFQIPQQEVPGVENKRGWKINQVDGSKLSISLEQSSRRFSKIVETSRITNVGVTKRKTSLSIEHISSIKTSQLVSNFIKENNNQEIKYRNKTKTTELDSNYFQYFNVYVKFVVYQKIQSSSSQSNQGNPYIAYEIKIDFILPNKHDLPQTWVITKRYTDFFELDQTLKVFLGLKQLPMYPRKQLTQLDTDQLVERQHGLEQYLKLLLNDKIYHHYALFKFIELSKEFTEEVKSFQDKSDYLEMCVVSKGHEQLIGAQKSFVKYTFNLERKNGEVVTVFLKRFSDFHKLQDSLKSRFKSDDILPEVPPKYISFGEKNPSLQREKQLTIYLNQLIHYPNVHDSIHLRQFLNYKIQINPHEKKSQINQQPEEIQIEQNLANSVIENLDDVFRTLNEVNETDENKLEEFQLGNRQKN